MKHIFNGAFNLRRRIFFSFSVLVFLFVINAIMTIITLQENKRLAAHISTVIDPSVQSLHDFRQLMIESKMYTTNWVFLRANQDDKSHLVIIHEHEYNKLKSKLNSLSKQWKNKLFHDSLNKVYGDFEVLLDIEMKIMSSLQKFEDYDDVVIHMEAESQLEEEVLPRTTQLMHRLQQIITFADNEREEENYQLQQSSVSLRTKIFLIAILIICAGVCFRYI